MTDLMQLSNPTSHQEYAISLAGLFAMTAFAAIGFALAARAGPVLPLLVVLTPWPTFLYVFAVRSWMNRFETVERGHSVTVDLLLISGLFLVLMLTLFAAAVAVYYWGPIGFLPIQALDLDAAAPASSRSVVFVHVPVFGVSSLEAE